MVNAVNWRSSYLNGREQIVNVNGTKSEPSKITCGVSQVSIIRSLLLLLYVNDMEYVVNCKLSLYVDDSALLVSGKDTNRIETILSNELQNVSNWLVDNKLSLQPGKKRIYFIWFQD